ncbi:pilus assembly PilX family protein [Sanguibacter suaedae]|uniref:Type 4 fimbrial biogenesis protein PilX N-terminal domain-containing protein n=1 Tax=Sanguibacter suaedae TaxID=2795737 RepID=A0A934I4C3_9MICO|nr:hypothetical protein [Sanguibacter suaedae]MBI9115354.1 hypothetical protein [Sanguibacter suaedae]
MRRAFRRDDDSGIAMVLVVGSMMTLMVLVLGGLAYVMQSERFARYDQDYTAAMSAAQAGVDDYISRLNRSDTYHAALDCSNTAMRKPMTASNSCGWNATTKVGWAPVTNGADPTTTASFHYEVDSTRVNTEGTILLTSTGRSKDVYRTIEVAVGKGGSTDYVYYTDFESADPANTVSYPNGAPNDSCGRSGNSLAKYFWQGRTNCSEIQFISSDTLDGRVFSNDAILSNGATFQQSIESANPGCQRVTASSSSWSQCLRSGSSGANFGGKKPTHSSALYLPDNSAAFATHPGCHYYGATRIVFNAAGTMTVWSKDSNFTGAVLSVPGPDGTVPSCGSGSALASSSGALVNVPNDMVIYVAAAPSNVQRRELFGDEIGGPTTSQLPLGNFSTDALTPSAGTSYVADLNMTETTRYRGEGNLYVQGTLKGRVTVAAAQSIIVTGDVVLAGGTNGSDMLGLVATNSVEVMHPRMATRTYNRECQATDRRGNCTRWSAYRWFNTNEGEAGVNPYAGEGTWPKRVTDPSTRTTNPSTGIQIAGSIQTLQHSFFVQRYDVGPNKGTLLVRGSIAQRWRGAVGTGSSTTGYSKLYTYDGRLTYSAPPYFPSWANSEWSLRYSGETPTRSEVKTG